MSRVGKEPVIIPDGVTVSLKDGKFSAKGSLGELDCCVVSEVDVEIDGQTVTVTPKNNSKVARQMWGTTRVLIHNVVHGVSSGFVKKLEIQGVGYRALMQGKDLKLQLGFSHDILYPVPEGIKVAIEGDKNNIISISGASKQRVGQIASEIRGYRPPEPYKGKGVRYVGEWILRKEGKKK